MRRVNLKNKMLFLVFCIIIFVIIGLLVYSIKFTKDKNHFSYEVTGDMVLFSDDYNTIDTTNGGKIEKKWNSDFYFIASDGSSTLLGNDSIIFDKTKKAISLLGEKFQVMTDGSVVKSDDVVEITDTTKSSFYKLDDRDYVIIFDEIYSADKTIFASKYLEVMLDKQGNASLLNDSINIKTINPLVLSFDNIKFDVANEKLIIKDLNIDLKQIIGSTNTYDPTKNTIETDYNAQELIESYNHLVDNFVQYATNHDYKISANNTVESNNVVINNSGTGSYSGSGGSGGGGSSNYSSSTNLTDIVKYVSLRGAVSYASYIDISYLVTDPENRYQVVYLLVTGLIDGEIVSQKIIVDKYDTKCRIRSLTPSSEYTISIGDIEMIYDSGEKKYVDNIEDVINIRTSKVQYSLDIEKISGGKVYFNYKMNSTYAFESADISLYIDGAQKSSMPIDCTAMISEKGFSSSFVLDTGGVYELRVENGVYASSQVPLSPSKKFVIPGI